MKYRSDIDGLRAVAVLPVVFYHAGVPGFSGGFVGVDVFFVISGYLITQIIFDEMRKGQFSILSFYERRARRILPALFVVLTICLAAGWFLLFPDDYDQMARSAVSALLFSSNIWFWQNSGGYFGGTTDYLPLLHTWSLAVEEQFYIIFPLFLMALVRLGRRATSKFTLVLVIVSLSLAIWASPRMPSASFYILYTRIWELGVGSLLALHVGSIMPTRWVREILAAVGLLAILVPVTLYNSATLFPGVGALPPVFGAAALIWAGSAGTHFAGPATIVATISVRWSNVLFVVSLALADNGFCAQPPLLGRSTCVLADYHDSSGLRCRFCHAAVDRASISCWAELVDGAEWYLRAVGTGRVDRRWAFGIGSGKRWG